MAYSMCKASSVWLKHFKKEIHSSVLLTKRNSFLYLKLIEITEKLVPAGIFQYLFKFHESNLYKQFKADESNSPKVLSFDDLAHGFVLWIGACGASTTGFVLEFLVFYIKMLIKNLCGLWMLMTLLVKIGFKRF